MHTVLITGGTGCIGAVTIYKLLQSAEIGKIVVASRTSNTGSLELWLDEGLDPRLEFASLDISDYKAIGSLLEKVSPTHIIHLGAYQSPDCSKHHIQGMEINVGGTMALLDAAEKLQGLRRFVFASSAAVYGMRSMYPQDVIEEGESLAPPNHYGIWKLAGEHLARLFYANTKVPTICLRINTTYGKGRDKGKTSAPTNVLKAIVMGASSESEISFSMPYQGRENYHFVEDVGAHFAACVLQPFDGFGVFNIKGKTISIEKFLSIARQEAEKLGLWGYSPLSIDKNAPPNLFVCDLSHDQIDQTFRDLPLTPIEVGVRKTLEEFKEMARERKLQFSKESS